LAGPRSRGCSSAHAHPLQPIRKGLRFIAPPPITGAGADGPSPATRPPAPRAARPGRVTPAAPGPARAAPRPAVAAPGPPGTCWELAPDGFPSGSGFPHAPQTSRGPGEPITRPDVPARTGCGEIWGGGRARAYAALDPAAWRRRGGFDRRLVLPACPSAFWQLLFLYIGIVLSGSTVTMIRTGGTPKSENQARCSLTRPISRT
jgi:hypothetical protein